MSACCKALLSEGLDLCVRARRLDAQERTNTVVEVARGEIDLERYAARHNAIDPDRPVTTRSCTIALWVSDQYDTDLADWERRARHHLSMGCTPTTPPDGEGRHD